MQTSIGELVKLGVFPSSNNPDIEKLERIQALLAEIQQPISTEEAGELIKLFGPDDCFGLSWTLLHIIETTPGWPLDDMLANASGEWIERLKQRSVR